MALRVIIGRPRVRLILIFARREMPVGRNKAVSKPNNSERRRWI